MKQDQTFDEKVELSDVTVLKESKPSIKEILTGKLEIDEVTRRDRNNFIKKVYSLLLMQLGITMVCVVCVKLTPAQDFIETNPEIALVCFVILIILCVFVFMKRQFVRKYPQNMIFLGVFTLFESYLVSFICTKFDLVQIGIAGLTTGVITITLTFYACYTKTDFTTKQAMIFAALVGLLISGIFLAFFYEFWLYILFCLVGILVYSLFIILDTQLIAGGRYDSVGYDDYILAAMLLYVDIVGLFVYSLASCKT